MHYCSLHHPTRAHQPYMICFLKKRLNTFCTALVDVSSKFITHLRMFRYKILHHRIRSDNASLNIHHWSGYIQLDSSWIKLDISRPMVDAVACELLHLCSQIIFHFNHTVHIINWTRFAQDNGASCNLWDTPQLSQIITQFTSCSQHYESN